MINGQAWGAHDTQEGIGEQMLVLATNEKWMGRALPYQLMLLQFTETSIRYREKDGGETVSVLVEDGNRV